MKRNFTQLFFLLFALCLTFTPAFNQDKPDINSFKTHGDAIKAGQECFRLTSAMNWQGGSVWHKEPISLNAPFEMELKLRLGCKDFEGADGMVFVFHTEDDYTGYRGEGIGFSGLAPSLGIEIDTYQNYHLNDPSDDHIAVMSDGQVDHAYSLAGPVSVKANTGNIEDCKLHNFKIKWTPGSNLLEIYMDGQKRISLRENIVKNIFYGNPKVYWGVTAATGGKNNRHEICFEKLSFEVIAETKFDNKTSKKILSGDAVALEKIQFKSGQSDLLPESKRELDKLVKLLKENPGMEVDVIGHTDSSGDANSNRILSEKRADAVAEYLAEKGISKKRIKPKGYGETYPLASNSTSSGRSINRRIEIIVSRPVP